MKKAIHIAGFTIGVIAVYTLTVACVLALAQNRPQRVQCQGPGFKDCKNLDKPQAGNADCKTPPCAPVSGSDDGYKWNPKTGEIEIIPQYYSGFDVPAVATSVKIYQDSSRCYPISNTDVSCPPMPVKTIFTCANKSRFLLFSEDGKAHCLKLVPHD